MKRNKTQLGKLALLAVCIWVVTSGVVSMVANLQQIGWRLCVVVSVVSALIGVLWFLLRQVKQQASQSDATVGQPAQASRLTRALTVVVAACLLIAIPAIPFWGFRTDRKHPIFQFQHQSYRTPRIAVVLPSHKRASLYYLRQMCKDSDRASCRCADPAVAETPLTFQVVVFEEIQRLLAVVEDSNSNPEVRLVASSPKLDAKIADDSDLKHSHVVVVGGPISTATFYAARDAILAYMNSERGITWGPKATVLPYDFSPAIYDQVLTLDRYGPGAFNAIVRNFTIGSPAKLDFSELLARHCGPDRSEPHIFLSRVDENYVGSHASQPGIAELVESGLLLQRDACAIDRQLLERGPISNDQKCVDRAEVDVPYQDDYGFFVYGPNPFDSSSETRIVLIAGTHAEGSICVLRELLSIRPTDWEDLTGAQSSVRGTMLTTSRWRYLSGLFHCTSSRARAPGGRLLEVAYF